MEDESTTLGILSQSFHFHNFDVSNDSFLHKKAMLKIFETKIISS